MSKTITSTELQKKTRAMIDWTRIVKEAIVIETYGKPMAALVSYDEYQNYLQYKQARADRFRNLREAAANNAEYNTLTEEEALVLVEEMRQELYDSGAEQPE